MPKKLTFCNTAAASRRAWLHQRISSAENLDVYFCINVLRFGDESVAALKFTKGFAAIWVFRRWKSRRGEIEFGDNIWILWDLIFEIELVKWQYLNFVRLDFAKFNCWNWTVEIELLKLIWRNWTVEIELVKLNWRNLFGEIEFI